MLGREYARWALHRRGRGGWGLLLLRGERGRRHHLGLRHERPRHDELWHPAPGPLVRRLPRHHGLPLRRGGLLGPDRPNDGNLRGVLRRLLGRRHRDLLRRHPGHQLRHHVRRVDVGRLRGRPHRADGALDRPVQLPIDVLRAALWEHPHTLHRPPRDGHARLALPPGHARDVSGCVAACRPSADHGWRLHGGGARKHRLA
mmetsp:Transcript_11062/g.34929  ORF Transcript_11062/g.34929 Transcript_11062/m.34929 type:complete len:201 (-) Transcript_11062:461-1063(-)